MSTALAAFRALRLSILGGGPIFWCLVLSRIGRPQFSAWAWPDVGDHRRSRHRISGFGLGRITARTRARAVWGKSVSSRASGKNRKKKSGFRHHREHVVGRVAEWVGIVRESKPVRSRRVAEGLKTTRQEQSRPERGMTAVGQGPTKNPTVSLGSDNRHWGLKNFGRKLAP